VNVSSVFVLEAINNQHWSYVREIWYRETTKLYTYYKRKISHESKITTWRISDAVNSHQIRSRGLHIQFFTKIK